MTLPNFLGIGAMRSGTTWLYQQLQTHREVFTPVYKELSFFDVYFDRGLEWYAKHFPSDQESPKYKAIGEITPFYMTHPDAAARIHRHIPDCRLLVILRNPANRVYSEYTKALRNLNFRGNFWEFIDQRPEALARGYYTEQLDRYLQLFPRDRFLVLTFEETMANPSAGLERLARFLDIDPGGFDPEQVRKKANASYLPRMPNLYSSAVKLRRFFMRNHMEWIDTTVNKLGLTQAARHIFRLGGPRSELPKMDDPTRARLNDHYAQEVQKLEKLLAMDLSIWRKPSGRSSTRNATVPSYAAARNS